MRVGTASRPTDRLAPSSWISFFMLEASFRTITRTSMALSSFQSPRARDPNRTARVIASAYLVCSASRKSFSHSRSSGSHPPTARRFSPASFRSSVALHLIVLGCSLGGQPHAAPSCSCSAPFPCPSQQHPRACGVNAETLEPSVPLLGRPPCARGERWSRSIRVSAEG